MSPILFSKLPPKLQKKIIPRLIPETQHEVVPDFVPQNVTKIVPGTYFEIALKIFHETVTTGLKKGLPFPILTLAEYMSVDAEGFCWGRNYRQAGYYAGKRNYWQILQNCHKNVMKMSQNCL